ncbi:MAG TPA: hypothetical protein VHC97_05350 [Thermoanaerobaculia bacterium]|jgi:hypothetical protein|nr:hypothetical protein [Thermoanaerobaculia bacterium]
MKRTRWYGRTLVTGIALLVASAAIAAPPQTSRRDRGDWDREPGLRTTEPRQLEIRSMKAERSAAGLPFDLPAGLVSPSETLTVAVSSGPRVFVQETIVLPDRLSAAPTISFLAHHQNELAQLRKLEAEALRFTVSARGKVIVDVPFADADRGSARLAGGGPVVGESRSVEVKLRDPRKGMQPDPECESACNDAFLECDYYCDHRGSCSYCNDQYSWCVFQCPQVCTEPKAVYDVYTPWTYIGSYNHGNICINYTYAYIFWEDVDRRYVYQRTEHCDGTYTDVYKSTQYRSSFCKEYIGPGCVGNFTNPPPTC